MTVARTGDVHIWRRVILCADDFALSPGVSAAIVDLIERGRLTATSCMTTVPNWRADSALLGSLGGRADLGLHLTFTDHAPLAALPRLAPAGRFPSAPTFARWAFSGRLDVGEIRAEIGRQLDAFESALGRAPDYVDGHHHVHIYPVVGEVLLEVLAERYAGQALYVRSLRERVSRVWRRGVGRREALYLAALGQRFATRLAARGFAHNDSFAGLYPLTRPRDYAKVFPRFFLGAGQRHLIACHPGRADDTLRARDPVVEQREVEYAFLASDACALTLLAHKIELARFAGFGH